jgi:hypothetical protein
MPPRALIALLVSLATLALAGAAPAGVAAARGGAYDPPVDPGSFGRRIDNPYFPLKPGTVYFYEGRKEGKVQNDRAVVTRRTKTILGVRCVVVVDTVSIGGKPIERTLDWYTQDARGNVWYFGEDSRDYEHGRWVASPGSWQAGVDGAEPGIIMEAHPRRGDVYRQEFYAGHAEDMARVLGHARGWLTVPYGTFRRALVTREWSPLEPGISGRKYYAPGIGLVQERALKGESEYMKLVAVLHR